MLIWKGLQNKQKQGKYTNSIVTFAFIYVCVCIYTPPRFVYSSFDKLLNGNLYFLTVVNNATVNIGLQVPVLVPDFRVYIQSVIGGSYSNSMFNFLRNLCLP